MDMFASSHEPSDMFEQLDAAASAEAMDPEDDLVVRMQSSARVQGGGRKAVKERKRRPHETSFSPSKAIAKRRPPRLKNDSNMKVDTTSSGRQTSAMAMKAAAAALPPPLKLKRSHSI
jgi:hypothetical protein